MHMNTEHSRLNLDHLISLIALVHFSLFVRRLVTLLVRSATPDVSLAERAALRLVLIYISAVGIRTFPHFSEKFTYEIPSICHDANGGGMSVVVEGVGQHLAAAVASMMTGKEESILGPPYSELRVAGST